MNKENIEQYCPNTIFNNGIISIGEFKTLEEAMNFPIKQVWCVNRDEDNKFQAYKNQGTRILIICDWNKSIQDATKFVVGLVFINGEIKYFDLNDIPLDSKQYENSIGHDAYSAIYSIADDNYRNNNQEIKENRDMNKKQVIRINESQLRQIVTESVKRVLNEAFPNGSVRGGFDKWTTVNRPGGGASLYSVEIGEGLHSDLYYAFAYDEQEALDVVVDYLEKKGLTGFFYDNEEIAQEYPDDFITAGNHCHLLRADGVVIHKIRDGR